MDKQIEEKLDNFEDVLEGFEDKKSSGEPISVAHTSILMQALESIVSKHTIAKWWSDEMRSRIAKLDAPNSKFPQAENSTDNDDIVDGDSTPGWIGHMWNDKAMLVYRRSED